MKVYVESLGCARNQVDSEHMLGQLSIHDWTPVSDPADADMIVVNTCSFIDSAADESIDIILDMAGYKTHGQCKTLVVAGCLPERYGQDITESLPEVDIFLGTGAGLTLVDTLSKQQESNEPSCVLIDPNEVSPEKADLPRVLSQSHMAYIKIAEGCSRHCTYCIIPSLRGRYRSRSKADIVREAESLVAQGSKELILVSESTTDYGDDLKPKIGLDSVLSELNDLSGDFWVRLLYANPDTLSDAVIDAVGQSDKICPYFDIPIQHASDRVLKAMGRPYTRADLETLFDKIRSDYPRAALRTTLITGFPGETDSDFEELLDFIKAVQFDHLGVFTYSDSEDLPSHGLSDHVPPEIAEERRDRIMDAQAGISYLVNASHVGRVCRVLIEEQPEEGLYLGRTDFQAPDVDGVTFVSGQRLTLGEFYDVTITDAHEYDLSGDVK